MEIASSFVASSIGYQAIIVIGFDDASIIVKVSNGKFCSRNSIEIA